MAITAADVNKLRKQTGAGMMDCKKALVETDGDFEAAVDVLRKKGQKVAAKRGDNETKEGLIYAQSTADGRSGVVLALSCETDFVAKNSDFQAFVQSLVDIAINKMPDSIDELTALAYNEKLSISEKLIEQIGVIGEKLVISGYEKINAECVVGYNHPGNQLATIVGLTNSSEAASDAGKQVAMQVAAMNPLALSKEGIDESTIARELEVGKDLAIQEGKPAEMADKIAQGRLGKFFKENTLLSQPFVRDNKQNVEQFLNGAESGLTVTEFKRLALS
ncbi:MAG: translation elongation factor Ts [Crocinitomicaceae bacterium]|jgi:elongation factor Ts|nr:translation elongation factor Ts [Crocinitomicaceae bacterium]MDB4075583.1 translation elongation factor Ts [Crocinitomicaceae bacterium]MDC1385394.1 translation elongation factor Ts [Crocinitomicaceae bacterium]|tara:strand:- start:4946 stop:5776 length:831 start_codon:yes stop_codon:yes gene_type:complete